MQVKRIGFTRNKRRTATRNGTERKRALFQEQLSRLMPEEIVYADESGIDNRDDYGYGSLLYLE